MIMIGLSACSYSPIDNSRYQTISKIEVAGDPAYSNYYGTGNWGMTHMDLLSSNDFKFRDSTGKFQVGDTIDFCKFTGKKTK